MFSIHRKPLKQPSTFVALTVSACTLISCAANNLATQSFDTEHGPVLITMIASGLDHPWGMAFLPDNRIIVTERSGQLRLIGTDGAVSPPLDGVPEVWSRGQGGLLDVALSPDFETTHRVFISYAEPGEGSTAGTAVAHGILRETGLDSVVVIFRQEPKVRSRVHFGSRLVFANDTILFITTGERGQRYDSQDLSRTLGKVIRVKLDGTVPADNPFINTANARPEIFSYGHRNLQGATLHPETGVLWTVEHGARGGDEINTPQPGRNYGWPVITYGVDYSGARIGIGTSQEGMEQPIHYWDPSIAPSGLMFYTGDRFPDWRNNLFVGSLKFQQLVRLEVREGQILHEERMLDGLGDRIRDVEQGPDGGVYLLTDEGNGRILRLDRHQ